jgi:hypothetical protein
MLLALLGWLMDGWMDWVEVGRRSWRGGRGLYTLSSSCYFCLVFVHTWVMTWVVNLWLFERDFKAWWGYVVKRLQSVMVMGW